MHAVHEDLDHVERFCKISSGDCSEKLIYEELCQVAQYFVK